MSLQDRQDPYHFKAGFHPKCPQCQKENIQVSLSEHLYGPANGQYEVIYCGDCHTFLGAHPVVLQNLFKGIKEADKIEYPQA
jgi:hypothetical protein